MLSPFLDHNGRYSNALSRGLHGHQTEPDSCTFRDPSGAGLHAVHTDQCRTGSRAGAFHTDRTAEDGFDFTDDGESCHAHPRWHDVRRSTPEHAGARGASLRRHHRASPTPADRRESRKAGLVRFIEAAIRGAWVIDPEPHTDVRGRFMRAWCVQEFAAHGIDFLPVQSNMGFSLRRGTVRGLHYQIAPHLEAKLVRCTRGSVFDVLVDLRPDSPTHGEWFGTVLSPGNGQMLFIPPLCAHGCQTLEDDSEILYMASASFAPAASRGLRYDDPTVAIRWPLPPAFLSEQDGRWPHLDPEPARNR